MKIDKFKNKINKLAKSFPEADVKILHDYITISVEEVYPDTLNYKDYKNEEKKKVVVIIN